MSNLSTLAHGLLLASHSPPVRFALLFLIDSSPCLQLILLVLFAAAL